MPRVGKREFPYTRQGREAADRYARQTGQLGNESGMVQTGENPMVNRNVYQTVTNDIRDRYRARQPQALDDNRVVAQRDGSGRGAGFRDARGGGVIRDRGPRRGPLGTPGRKALDRPSDRDTRSLAIQLQMKQVLDQLSPEDQMDPRAVDRMVELVNERARSGALRARHVSSPEYGRWGYQGETRRQHEDRLWDRDWDEDVSGRRWEPRRA